MATSLYWVSARKARQGRVNSLELNSWNNFSELWVIWWFLIAWYLALRWYRTVEILAWRLRVHLKGWWVLAPLVCLSEASSPASCLLSLEISQPWEEPSLLWSTGPPACQRSIKYGKLKVWWTHWPYFHLKALSCRADLQSKMKSWNWPDTGLPLLQTKWDLDNRWQLVLHVWPNSSQGSLIVIIITIYWFITLCQVLC